MRLKIKEFNNLAKERGYKNGYELFCELGGGRGSYKLLKQGLGIGYEMVKEMYNVLGGDTTNRIINFEGGNINELKSKFVEIDGHLF